MVSVKMNWMVLENIVIYVAIAAISIGGFALGAGGTGMWSLLLLIFVNTRGLRP